MTYSLRPTYSITRGKTCGTLLLAEEDQSKIYLAASTLNAPLGAGIRNHIFCTCRSDWDHDTDDLRYFDERSTPT